MFPDQRYPDDVSPIHHMSGQLLGWFSTPLSSSLRHGRFQNHQIAKPGAAKDTEDAVASRASVDVVSKQADNCRNHMETASALWTVAPFPEEVIAGVECCRDSAAR